MIEHTATRLQLERRVFKRYPFDRLAGVGLADLVNLGVMLFTRRLFTFG